MGTGRLIRVELTHYGDNPYCLYCDLYNTSGGRYVFDTSDIGKFVSFTIPGGPTFISEPIYENESGNLIIKANAEDDNNTGVPTSFPAIYIRNGDIYYYPTDTVSHNYISSEFYVPRESYLNSTGLIYLWSKIKSLVNNKVDKVTGKGLSTNDYTDSHKYDVEHCMTYKGIASDANNANKTGLYHFNGSTPNAPTTSAYDCLVINISGTRVVQLCFRDTSTTETYFYRRVYYDGTWGSWFRYSGTKI